jgi:hypothetical protein
MGVSAYGRMGEAALWGRWTSALVDTVDLVDAEPEDVRCVHLVDSVH